MKTSIWMGVALLGGIGWTPAVRGCERVLEDVAICVGDNISLFVASHAQTKASAIFRQIGIHLKWHSADSAFCRKTSHPKIEVTYSLKTAEQAYPGAFAYAMPYEGVHIEVFYDRIRGKTDLGVSHVLAHVLAHEISHILQGNDRHADSGIMKARWDKADFAQMENGNLPFGNEDVLKMRGNLPAWANRAQPATFAPSAKP